MHMLHMHMHMQVVEAEGVAALFKGATERVLRSSPQFGATCMCSRVNAACACSGAMRSVRAAVYYMCSVR